MMTMGEAGSACASGPMRDLRVSLERDEWTPPQRPLSDETTTKSLRLGVSLGDAVLKISMIQEQGS